VAKSAESLLPKGGNCLPPGRRRHQASEEE